MKEINKYRKIVIIILFVLSFICLLLSFMFYNRYLKLYNQKENKANVTHNNNDFFSIYPRGYDTDSWNRDIHISPNEIKKTHGEIYEIKVKNNTGNEILNWKIRINIHDNCFLNNGWCGTFEIHQFDGINENVQKLDLRNYDKSQITLNYFIDGIDIFIPLKEGDYIIYYPDENTKEYPIFYSKTEYSVKTGVIFYENINEKINLDDIVLYYYANKDYWNDQKIKIIIFFSIIWFTSFVSFIVYVCNDKINERKMLQKEKIIKESLSVFTNFFEAKDPYTNGHSKRVAEYSMLIAEKLGMSAEECKNAYYIALMHDCGKCYIPDSILKKPGRLTDNEYHSIIDHTLRGAAMLKNFSSIPGIEDGALYHHERYDGKGYPTGKAGEEIPLIGRIICVADSFDAMNSERCYRNGLSREYIINELLLNSGNQFDPKIVACMIKLIEEDKVTFENEYKGKEILNVV